METTVWKTVVGLLGKNKGATKEVKIEENSNDIQSIRLDCYTIYSPMRGFLLRHSSIDRSSLSRGLSNDCSPLNHTHDRNLTRILISTEPRTKNSHNHRNSIRYTSLSRGRDPHRNGRPACVYADLSRD